jgi:hypothetical protein
MTRTNHSSAHERSDCRVHTPQLLGEVDWLREPVIEQMDVCVECEARRMVAEPPLDLLHVQSHLE